jgi:hypothetical protein
MISARKYTAVSIGAFALFVVHVSADALALQDGVPSTQWRSAETETDATTKGLWLAIREFLRDPDPAQPRTGDAGAKKSDRASGVASVRMSGVGGTYAIITWSPSVFSNVRVYYASSSPVVVSDATHSVVANKPWKRPQVTLKGLSPNTIYFYKVVAHTPSETIVSAEASFKTVTE